MNAKNETYEKMSLKQVLGFAAPNTWTASVLPVIFGVVLSYVLKGTWDPLMSVCLLLICMLMQSAVNTLNDYSDYVKETDTLENCDDPSEAILVYHRLNPKAVLLLGFGFLAAAALLGVWVTIKAGFAPLIIGVIGGVVILLYSFGKLPISYIPLGELISGFIMGGLIPLAVFSAITGEIDFFVLVYAVPFIISVGLLMNTNNMCDIEKDVPAGKKTIPVLLGRKRSRVLYACILVANIIYTGCIVLIFFTKGAYLLIPVFACGIFFIVKQMKLSLGTEVRKRSMAGIVRINIVFGLGYTAAILLHGFL